MAPLSSKKKKLEGVVVQEITTLYETKLLPIEKKYFYNKFHASEILPSELSAKPQVLLLGQYSTGKTSFIRNLLGMDYPGIHIGPEPTTDKFIAVVHGDETKVIKGNSLTAVDELPYAGLSTFGGGFLNKFEAALTNAPILKEITIIDTPGVLSGEKQRISRGYDFAQVSKWFAERSDLILLLFDSYKLDISDEFKGIIENLKNFDDKVHCVMNKADQLDPESLMKVYGALLWSMGKIFQSAEVPRVYCGSFRTDDQLQRKEFEKLFEKDRNSLMSHLSDLPKLCGMRKVNEMVKRIRLNIVNVCIIGYLQSKMPYLWGHDQIQSKLIQNLEKIYVEVRHIYNLPEGDFPPLEEFKAKLQLSDFRQFPKLQRSVLIELKDMLTYDIPSIFKSIAGVSSTKSSSSSTEEDEGGAVGGVPLETENRNLQAMLNFDLNSFDKRQHTSSQSILIHIILPFVIALLVLLLGFMISYFVDEGQSFKTFLAKIKSFQSNGGQ